MNKNKMVVFDLDGTLNQTHLYAVPAHKKALADLGIFDKTDADIIDTFGARGMDMVSGLIGSSDEQAGRDYLKQVGLYEQDFIKEFSGEFDGITAMLQSLKADGYITAVCSNASERYIRMVLEALNLIILIDHIQPLLPDLCKDDTLRLLIERVKPEKTVMVGDRIYDKLAAAHNDIPFIGCLYGFEPSEIADAEYPVTHPMDIIASVKFAIG